jgi:hypothetical protein
VNARRRITLGCLAGLAAACGMKGPPLAPLRPVPARVDDLAARRLGDEVQLRLTVPSRNQDGTLPADLDCIEIYAFTDDPLVVRRSGPLANRLLLDTATLVATIAVRPPPPPDDEEARPASEPAQAPDDPRPAQGAVAVVRETITEVALQPVSRPRGNDDAGEVAAADATPSILVPAIEPLAVAAPLVRYYTAVGVSRHRRRGAFSARIAVPLGPPPAAPSAVKVDYTESEATLTWNAPPGAPARIQAPPAKGVLRSRPVLGQLEPWAFNVYEVSAEPAASGVAPLNETPLESASFVDDRVEFGATRCYEVRAIQTLREGRIESAPSARACVTFADVFAPAAPRNLAAVVSEGAVSLVWEPNSEPDLGGYLVLRGTAPGATLQALTVSPIGETTFRDEQVTPGTRYVYAVVAVDKTTPPNVSKESNRVEEIAR